MDEQRIKILLEEYKTARSNCDNNSARLWQSGAIILAAGLAGLTIVVSKDLSGLNPFVMIAIAVVAVTSLLSWLWMVDRWDSYANLLMYRMREIEKELGMSANRYISFVDGQILGAKDPRKDQNAEPLEAERQRFNAVLEHAKKTSYSPESRRWVQRRIVWPVIIAYVVLAVLSIVSAIWASDVPPYLNYQGTLTDAAGDPLPDGNYSVTFRIWDAATQGTELWAEGRLISVESGLFNVLLGSVVPISDSLFDSPDRWLGVQIGPDDELTPRTRLVTVPFAWHAQSATEADTADHSRDKTTDANELISGILDTARYSAYEDLLTEGRIGDQIGQLASGEHSHPAPGLQVLKDTVTVTQMISSIDGDVVFKNLVIPAGDLGHFLLVRALCQGSATLEAFAKVNGNLIESASVNSAEGTYFSNRMIRFGNGTQWDTRFAAPITVDPALPVSVEFGASTQSPTPISATIYTVIVEYDKE